jgi:hypothetical protein
MVGFSSASQKKRFNAKARRTELFTAKYAKRAKKTSPGGIHACHSRLCALPFPSFAPLR